MPDASPSSFAGEPTLDPAVLDQIAELDEPGQPSLVVELIDVYLADEPRRVEAIETAARGSDPAALSRAAHALKGAALSLGVKACAAICAELEKRGRAGDLTGAVELVAALRAESARATEALRRRRG